MNFLVRLFKLTVVIIVAMWVSTLTLAAIILFFGGFFGILVGLGSQDTVATTFEKKVIFGEEDAPVTFVSIPITGLIVGDSMDVSDPLGFVSQNVTYGYDVKETLKKLSEDEEVSGIILDINSPGGTIYGAHAIAEGVEKYREKTGKPVLSFVSGLAASGAYWVAVSADDITADMGTSVGSIGVITGPFQYYDGVISEDGGAFTGGVVTERGIETTYITAGESKDVGNPYRRLTEKETQTLQTMVNNEYDNFVDYVSQRRSIPNETIRSTIGAMVYDTKTALEYQLIDQVASREGAYELLAERSGKPIEDVRVVREQSPTSFLRMLFQSASSFQQPNVHHDYCVLSTVSLAYHGDILSLCGE